ncbi:BTB/POZ domain-containing protein Ktl [Brevipalpus obovatus]|uniref:BTB/POZ domain-containing protein Ktl n=1 Tax=Brevipalpus obovatus TaxID=246614 RepID=UPI003D9EA7D3
MCEIIELDIGGKFYTTKRSTLVRDPNSLLAKLFSSNEIKEWNNGIKSTNGRFFIDREGDLFKYILDYLRNDCKLILPSNFADHDRLRMESEYFKLDGLVKALNVLTSGLKSMSLVTATPSSSSSPSSCIQVSPQIPPISPSSVDKLCGYITIGYRGSFSFGKDGLGDVKFRKLTRILVAGKVALCREVFGDNLNESRDPDHTSLFDRYTSRFYLKHQILEQCFDALQENGFRCVASCGSGTSNNQTEPPKPGQDSEENRWNHYNEFVFCRP